MPTKTETTTSENGTGEAAEQEAVVFALPLDVAQALMNYLVTRPYTEVFPLVQALQGLPRITE